MSKNSVRNNARRKNATQKKGSKKKCAKKFATDGSSPAMNAYYRGKERMRRNIHISANSIDENDYILAAVPIVRGIKDIHGIQTKYLAFHERFQKRTRHDQRVRMCNIYNDAHLLGSVEGPSDCFPSSYYMGIVIEARWEDQFDDSSFPSGICVMFPQIFLPGDSDVPGIKTEQGFIQAPVDTHLWLFFKDMVGSTSHGFDVHIGDHLYFYGECVQYSSYEKGKEITRNGIGRWLPIDSELVFAEGNVRRCMPTLYEEKAFVFRWNVATRTIEATTKSELAADVKELKADKLFKDDYFETINTNRGDTLLNSGASS